MEGDGIRHRKVLKIKRPALFSFGRLRDGETQNGATTPIFSIIILILWAVVKYLLRCDYVKEVLFIYVLASF